MGLKKQQIVFAQSCLPHLETIQWLKYMHTLEFFGHNIIGCIVVRPVLCCKRLESEIFLTDLLVNGVDI